LANVGWWHVDVQEQIAAGLTGTSTERLPPFQSGVKILHPAVHEPSNELVELAKKIGRDEDLPAVGYR
jgi:hypothetical protein